MCNLLQALGFACINISTMIRFPLNCYKRARTHLYTCMRLSYVHCGTRHRSRTLISLAHTQHSHPQVNPEAHRIIETAEHMGAAAPIDGPAGQYKRAQRGTLSLPWDAIQIRSIFLSFVISEDKDGVKMHGDEGAHGAKKWPTGLR